MRVVALSVWIVLLFSIISVESPPASAAVTTIRLTCNPEAIYADGVSICTISAEIRDGSGDLLPDGKTLHFTSSLGIIDGQATTMGGVARVMLRSGLQAGRAMISAVLLNDGQAVAQTQVEFLAPGAKMETDACLTISSDRYLAYAADSQTVDASGGASVRHRGLEVKAEDIQLEVGRNLLRAKGKTGGEQVTVTRGSKTIKAILLAYDTNSLQGSLVTEREDGKLATLAFNGVDLSTAEPQSTPDQSLFSFADLSNTQVLVKAKSITIRPKHDVQFKKAELYMDGGKAFKLPLYLIPLAAVGPAAGFQYFGVTSSGFKVDIPMYYSLTPSGTGAVRISNQSGGWSRYASGSGWGVDIEQSYATGAAEGRVTVGQVNRKDWGIGWQHTQQFSPTSRLTSYFGFPAHENLFGQINFNKSLKSSSFGLNLQGTKYRGADGSFSNEMYLQTNPKPLGSRLNYSLALESSLYNQQRVYVQKLDDKEDPIIVRRTEMAMSNGLKLQLYANPLRFGSTSTLTGSLSMGQDWGGNRAGFGAFGNAMFTTSFGKSAMGVGYSYILDPSLIGDYGHHALSMNYGLYGSRLTASLYGVYTLDRPITSAFGTLGYRLTPAWKLDVRGTYQRFGEYDPLSDLEFGLGHTIGSQDVTLVWSREYHKFRIEMGSLGF